MHQLLRQVGCFPVPNDPSGRCLAYSASGCVPCEHLVVCLPGLLETRKAFEPLLRMAGSWGRCLVVALDYCGRGGSDALPLGTDYRASVYLDDVRALLAHLHELGLQPRRTSLVGSSMGGLIALHAALKSDRPIHCIVLNDVGARIDWSSLHGLYTELSAGVNKLGLEAFAETLQVDPRAVTAAQSTGHWDLPTGVDLWGMRFDELLAGVESRLALVFSQHSPMCPAESAERVRAARPDTRLRRVQGAAHPAPWTPETLDWLAGSLGLTQIATEATTPSVSTSGNAQTGLTRAGNNPVALITGASSGIGRETALELARRGWVLVLAGRSQARVSPVLDAIATLPHAPPPRFLPLELDDLQSVRVAAAHFLELGWPLDLLVNNAGVAGERGLTRSGFEYAFGVNHIGHFALTLHLWPALIAARQARVVTVASRAHRWVWHWNWERLRQPTRSWTGVEEYARSKLANVLFSVELARRAGGLGVSSYSLHPGVVDTEIWRRLPRPLRAFNRLRLIDARMGARTTLHCALHASARESGQYFADGRPAEADPLATDPQLARALWERSLEWTGLDDVLPG
jgi:NAD(P)-dependent dehydrogenase (short-subunit alcohol dehydrogenase family)/pimeloyl-ACP methyl ester carboxylesterase